MVDLNEDLTACDSFEPFLKKSLSKHKEIPAGSILQIQHISNISVAKQDGRQSYEAEKHILKVTLTDGDATVYALVAEPITRLNLNTPPGTKLKFLHNAPAHGQLILVSRNNVQILGGDVPKLIEKWEFQRKLDIKKDWGAAGIIEGSEGPPLWRPFGHKAVPMDVAVLRSMKAMDIVNEKKDAASEDKNATQFDQQRHEAISELMEKSVKQKWQKPNKHLVDKEVQDIMDEGFSFAEASNALNRFKNPQKALRFLKADRGELPTQKSLPQEERKDKRRKNPKGNDDEDDTAPIPREYQRPTNNISLFGFIADTINIPGAEVDENSSNNYLEGSEYENGSGYRGYPRRGGRGRGSRGGRGGFIEDRSSGFGSRGIGRGGYGDRGNRSGFEDRSNSRGGGFGDRGNRSEFEDRNNTRGRFGGDRGNRSGFEDRNNSRGGFGDRGNQNGFDDRGGFGDRNGFEDRNNSRGGYGDRGNRGGFDDRRGGYGDRGNRGGYGDRGNRGGYGDRGNRGGYGDRGNRGGYGDRGNRGGFEDRNNSRGGFGDRGSRGGYSRGGFRDQYE